MKYIILLIISLVVVNISSAQHISHNHNDSFFAVDVSRVLLIEERYPEYSILSTAWNFNGRYVLSSGISINSSLPFVFVDIEELSLRDDYEQNSFAIGNPYIGLGIPVDLPTIQVFELSADIGAFIPVVSIQEENIFARDYGIFANYNNTDRYISNTLSIPAILNFKQNVNESAGVNIYGGATLWIPTEDREYRDDEFILEYGISAGTELQELIISGILDGRYFATFDGDEFIHSIGGNLGLNLETIQPALFINTPIQGFYEDVVDFKFGLSLLINMGEGVGDFYL